MSDLESALYPPTCVDSGPGPRLERTCAAPRPEPMPCPGDCRIEQVKAPCWPSAARGRRARQGEAATPITFAAMRRMCRQSHGCSCLTPIACSCFGWLGRPLADDPPLRTCRAGRGPLRFLARAHMHTPNTASRNQRRSQHPTEKRSGRGVVGHRCSPARASCLAPGLSRQRRPQSLGSVDSASTLDVIRASAMTVAGREGGGAREAAQWSADLVRLAPDACPERTAVAQVDCDFDVRLQIPFDPRRSEAVRLRCPHRLRVVSGCSTPTPVWFPKAVGELKAHPHRHAQPERLGGGDCLAAA